MLAGMNLKALGRLFHTDESLVVILDDRPNVWSYSDCLFTVRRFQYFSGTADVNVGEGVRIVGWTLFG